MKRHAKFLNDLVNISIKDKTGNISTLSGHLVAVGKEHILLIDQDSKEHSFKRQHIEDIKQITASK